jgi:transposase
MTIRSLRSLRIIMSFYRDTTMYENMLSRLALSSFVIGATSPTQNLILATFGHHELSPHFVGARIAMSFERRSLAKRQLAEEVKGMEAIYERCCGVDVHKKKVVACVIAPEGKEVRTFGTMTEDLLELAGWLKNWRVTHVAMESTGVYWKPIYNLLEGDFSLVLGNAQHIKTVPGRKTDVKDAEWIADLLRHGLIRGSFVPERSQRELRELLRYRTSLVQEETREVNRIQKVLEGANIKLGDVASDVLGASGKAMLEAIVQGVDDPKALADLAKGRLRDKLPALERALHGLIGPHQRMVMQCQLRHLNFLDDEIARLDKEVARRMDPFEESVQQIDDIPGIATRTAQVILGEIGLDMTRFPTASHLASWAGVSPGNNMSAGKRKSGRTTRGNHWLRSALVQAARGAVRTSGTYLNAQYHRLAARRGDKRAIIAVAHSILVIIYNMLRNKTRYEDMGIEYFDKRDRQAIIRRTIRRFERMGYTVTIAERQPVFS